MPEEGTGETIELTLFMITASDSCPHGWVACTTVYAVNEEHARRRAWNWLDQIGVYEAWQ